jgi:hypothetical protein
LARRRSDSPRTQDEDSPSRCRELWAAVVLQALEDIRSEPLSSLDYLQAVSFFAAGGEWAQARAAIADQLGLHPDELERVGRSCIDTRRAAEGLAPLPPRERPRVSMPRRAVPQQAFMVRPEPRARQDEMAGARSASIQRKRAQGASRLPPNANPFFPRDVAVSDWKGR